MKCIKCGTENQDGVIQCISCGNVLGAPSVQTLVQPQEVSTEPSVSIQQPVQPQVVTPVAPASSEPVLSVQEAASNILVQPQEVSTEPSVSVQQPVQPQVVTPVVPASSELVQQVTNINSLSVGNIGSVEPVNGTGGKKPNSKNKKLVIILIVLIVLLLASVGIAIWVYFEGQAVLEKRKEEMEEPVYIIWTPSKYDVGTEVTLVDDSSWYVLSENGDIVTLLAKDYYGDRTHFSDTRNDYEVSVPKNILETEYLPELSNSLTSNGGNIDGLKVRLITVEEIRSIADIGEEVSSEKIELDSTYKWLYHPGGYWTATQTTSTIEEGLTIMYYVESWDSFGNVVLDEADGGLVKGREFYIRPVIELNVSNIKA